MEAARVDLPRQLAEALCRIHSISPPASDGAMDPVDDALRALGDQIAQMREAHPALGQVLAWLDRRRPAASRVVQVHGDFRTGNFLVDASGLSAKSAQMWADADKGDVFEELDDFLGSRGGNVNWLASMAQDVHKGRHSEIDFMNGLISRKGREVGVPTPYNDAIIEAMHGIDDGSIKPGPATIDQSRKDVGR